MNSNMTKAGPLCTVHCTVLAMVCTQHSTPSWAGSIQATAVPHQPSANSYFGSESVSSHLILGVLLQTYHRHDDPYDGL